MPTETMKAVRIHEFGGPEVLVYEEAPMPVLQPGEALVRTRAVGINPPDWYLRDGYRTLPPEWRPAGGFPIIPGTDISGVVEAVSEGVEGFSPGDEVYAMVKFPAGVFGGSRAYADYVAVPAGDLASKPAGINHVQAAGAPMSLLTAWQFMIDLGHDEPNPVMPARHVPVPLSGKTVLVNGAAGGVGHLAVQIAKWQGARVIAVASERHEAFLRGLGADLFIDYRKVAPEEAVSEVDLVIDAVGWPKTGRFLPTIKRGGALYPIFPLGFADRETAERLGVTVSATQVRSSGTQLAQVGRLLDDATIRVAIDSIFPLADARSAHERAGRGNVQGKIVLTIP